MLWQTSLHRISLRDQSVAGTIEAPPRIARVAPCPATPPAPAWQHGWTTRSYVECSRVIGD